MQAIVRIIVGLGCGAIVGSALGILAAMGLGYLSRLNHPDDPSAGSVAIVVIITAPLGALVGAALGLVVLRKRPQLFYRTIVPIALLLAALLIAFSIFAAID
jgi:hypothetical protein